MQLLDCSCKKAPDMAFLHCALFKFVTLPQICCRLCSYLQKEARSSEYARRLWLMHWVFKKWICPCELVIDSFLLVWLLPHRMFWMFLIDIVLNIHLKEIFHRFPWPHFILNHTSKAHFSIECSQYKYTLVPLHFLSHLFDYLLYILDRFWNSNIKYWSEVFIYNCFLTGFSNELFCNNYIK